MTAKGQPLAAPPHTRIPKPRMRSTPREEWRPRRHGLARRHGTLKSFSIFSIRTFSVRLPRFLDELFSATQQFPGAAQKFNFPSFFADKTSYGILCVLSSHCAAIVAFRPSISHERMYHGIGNV